MEDFLNNKVIREDMENIYGSLDWSWTANKTFFITGAYGMLASYCVYFLIYLNERCPKYGISIIAQGRNQEKMYRRFGKYINAPYFNAVGFNICEPILLEGKIDYIIHAASPASPQFYAVNPSGTLLPNTVGTYNLLELAREKNTEGFLFFSSGDVYGELPSSKSECTEEDSGYINPMNLRSCYGESKRMGETMCKAWSSQYNVPTKCVRIAHTYGPTLDLENDERLFSEFVKNIVYNQDIVMKSDGSAVRMFCYISDAAEAFFKILKCGSPGEAYNMCNTDGRISVKGLANLLVNLFPEKELKIIEQERSGKSVYMESPIKKSPVFSAEKLGKLGWEPKVGIEDGFRRTIMSFTQD